jgi:hypothetical protein
VLAERKLDESAGEAEGPEIVSIRHKENSGVGAAIKTGYRRVIEDGLDVAVVMNGDGQMDPDVCHRLLDPVVTGRAAYAKGNRLLAREQFAEMSRFRLFGNFLLSYLTKAASGYWKLMDPQNGYTAISVTALDTIALDGLCDRYGFCNDLLIALNTHRLTVADVSIEAIYGEETSTIRYRRFIPRVSGLLLTGLYWRLRTRYLVWDFHPLVALYAVGALGTVGSVLGTVGAISAGKTVLGVLLATTLLVLSMALLAFGSIFDLLANADLELRIRDPDARIAGERASKTTVVAPADRSDTTETVAADVSTETSRGVSESGR